MGCGASKSRTAAPKADDGVASPKAQPSSATRQPGSGVKRKAPPAATALQASAAGGAERVAEAIRQAQLPDWSSATQIDLAAWLAAVHACLDAIWEPLLTAVESQVSQPAAGDGKCEAAASSDGGSRHGWGTLGVENLAQMLRGVAGSATPTIKAASAGLLDVAAALWPQFQSLQPAASGGEGDKASGSALAETDFINRSLVRLLGIFSVIMFRRVTVEDRGALEAKAAAWGALCDELGLGRPQLCTLLDAGAKATLLYVDQVAEGDGQCRLNCGRQTALWDARPQWERSCAGGEPGRSCKLFPRFYSKESGGWEQGEGHGPRKELFALVGQQMLRGCEAQPKLRPVLPYVAESRHHWFDASATEDADTMRLLRFAGWLMGQTVCNRATLQVRLPLLLFRKLVAGSEFVADAATLREFDPQAAQSIQALRKLSDADFGALLELEETPGLSRGEYVDAAVRRLLVDSIGWQFDAFREGFAQALPASRLRAVQLTAAQLQAAVCGAVGDGSDEGEDFSIRQTFRVVMDDELQRCAPLCDALWSVLDGWSPRDKRKFIKFVTGSARLPAVGSEVLTVEMPFDALGVDELVAMAGTLPQAHTCDNLLELPNYWAALCARAKLPPAEASGGKAEALLDDLRQTVHRQLATAVFECDAYGLDEGTTPADVEIPFEAAALPCNASREASSAAGAPTSDAVKDLTISPDASPLPSRPPPKAPPSSTTGADVRSGSSSTTGLCEPPRASSTTGGAFASSSTTGGSIGGGTPRGSSTTAAASSLAAATPRESSTSSSTTGAPTRPAPPTATHSGDSLAPAATTCWGTSSWGSSTTTDSGPGGTGTAARAQPVGAEGGSEDSATEEDLVEMLAMIGPDSPAKAKPSVHTPNASLQDRGGGLDFSPRRERVVEPDDLEVEHLEL